MTRRGFELIVFLGSLCLIGYLMWHAVNGERSFSEVRRISAEIETLTAERDAIRAKRVALDRRVALLRPESIDPDMLEELARVKLGFVHPDDIIVYLKP